MQEMAEAEMGKWQGDAHLGLLRQDPQDVLVYWVLERQGILASFLTLHNNMGFGCRISSGWMEKQGLDYINGHIHWYSF